MVDEDGLVGMVTWKDTYQALSIDPGSSGCFEVPWMNKLRVSDIMKRDFLTLVPYLAVGLAAEAMLKCRTDGLPVISHGKLVGIITEHDIDRMFTPRNNGEMRNSPHNKLTKQR